MKPDTKKGGAASSDTVDKYSDAELIKVQFRTLDKDGNGLIDKDELKRYFKDWSDDDIEDVFRYFDHDHSGYLDYEEFVEWALGHYEHDPAQKQKKKAKKKAKAKPKQKKEPYKDVVKKVDTGYVAPSPKASSWATLRTATRDTEDDRRGSKRPDEGASPRDKNEFALSVMSALGGSKSPREERNRSKEIIPVSPSSNRQAPSLLAPPSPSNEDGRKSSKNSTRSS